MKYTKEKAQEIFERFEKTDKPISPHTLRVWASRGSIPDRYDDKEYRRRQEPKSRRELAEIKRLDRVMANEKINKSALLEIAGVPRTAWVDHARATSEPSHMTLDYRRAVRLKAEVNRLRVEIAAAIEGLAAKSSFTDAEREAVDRAADSPVIVLTQLFGRIATDSDPQGAKRAYERFIVRRNGKRESPPHEDWETSLLIDRLSVFILESSLN